MSRRLRTSTATESMPFNASRCESIRPAGPAPTMATSVCVTAERVMVVLRAFVTFLPQRPRPQHRRTRPDTTSRLSFTERLPITARSEQTADAAGGNLQGAEQTLTVVLKRTDHDGDRGHDGAVGLLDDGDGQRACAQRHFFDG